MTNETPEPITLDPISYIIAVFFAFSAVFMPLLHLAFIGVMSREVGILFAFKCFLIFVPQYVFYWPILVGHWSMVRHGIFLEPKYWRSFGLVVFIGIVSGSASLVYSRRLKNEPARESLVMLTGNFSFIIGTILMWELIWSWAAYFQVRREAKKAANRAATQP